MPEPTNKLENIKPVEEENPPSEFLPIPSLQVKAFRAVKADVLNLLITVAIPGLYAAIHRSPIGVALYQALKAKIAGAATKVMPSIMAKISSMFSASTVAKGAGSVGSKAAVVLGVVLAFSDGWRLGNVWGRYVWGDMNNTQTKIKAIFQRLERAIDNDTTDPKAKAFNNELNGYFIKLSMALEGLTNNKLYGGLDIIKQTQPTEVKALSVHMANLTKIVNDMNTIMFVLDILLSEDFKKRYEENNPVETKWYNFFGQNYNDMVSFAESTKEELTGFLQQAVAVLVEVQVFSEQFVAQETEDEIIKLLEANTNAVTAGQKALDYMIKAANLLPHQ